MHTKHCMLKFNYTTPYIAKLELILNKMKKYGATMRKTLEIEKTESEEFQKMWKTINVQYLEINLKINSVRKS